MITFKFEAKDSRTGEIVKSELQANNAQEAAKALNKEGLSPLNISVKDEKGNPLSRFRERIKPKDRVLFARQLSTLINAGLPLVQSLRSVTEQTTSKPFRNILNKIINDIEAGSKFSSALEKYPKVFNAIFVSLVGAGEISGTLDKALERVALQQEKDAEIMSKVRGALAYPAIVLLVMGLVVSFMIVKVLPQVEGIYADLPGAKLPFITVALLAVAHFIIDFWWVVIIVIGLSAFFSFRWAQTGPGKQIVDKLKMRIWPIGPLFMKLYMARFARTGSTLVGSGVPLLQVLDITSKAVSNVHIEASLRRASDKVRGGKALSLSLENDPNFLKLVPNMLKIGEQSGQIEQMMEKIAEYFEKEVDNQVKAISTIIEPVMMILLGVIAFIIVAAILLPIYGLAGQINTIR